MFSTEPNITIKITNIFIVKAELLAWPAGGLLLWTQSLPLWGRGGGGGDKKIIEVWYGGGGGGG